MNDSFLEDMELMTVEQKAGSTVHHAERNITRRRSQLSPVHPSHHLDEINLLRAKQTTENKISPAMAATKITHRRSVNSKENKIEARRPTSCENKVESREPKVPDRRSKSTDKKLKPVENTNHLEIPKPKVDPKSRPRRSVSSSKESSRCSDGSNNENSRPSDSSKESIILAETPKERGSGDAPNYKRKTEGNFEVAMLNSVKEIVSTYTKNETREIIRAMQEVYINSQANLIKLMLEQTDDILAEQDKHSPRLLFLVEENERLKEYNNSLEARVKELSKSVADHKQENLQLRNRCEELLKSAGAKENNRCFGGSNEENNCSADLPKKYTSAKSRALEFSALSRKAKK